MKTIITFATLSLAMLAAIPAARPCSVFAAHDATTALIGNNEDYDLFYVDETLIWFVPATAGKYGYVAWGYKHNHLAQGGMNDQGLFWDGLATPVHPVTISGTKPFTLTSLEEVIQTSKTVDEAIANLQQYQLTQIMAKAQLMFADKTGASAIFDGDTVTKPTGSYQIATNFLPPHPELGNHPCWRYTKLEQLMTSGLKLTPDYFASMAAAVKQGANTLYTTIADLKAGTITLYYWGDFTKPVLLDLAAELAKGKQEHTIADLFKSTASDLGVDVGADAGAPDAGATADGAVDGGARDAAAPGPKGGDDDSSCSVAAGRSPTPAALPLWLLLVALAVRARRRRR